ncbi:hypothetical protein [Sandaracinus amylolyticus]|nr:hypothetical protein [Sandaracinus amylolyticus]
MAIDTTTTHCVAIRNGTRSVLFRDAHDAVRREARQCFSTDEAGNAW